MTEKIIIDKIKESIRSSDPTAEAHLFGSRARGDNRPDSDWDLLILVDNPKVTPEVEDKFREKLYDIELESGHIISVFIYTKDFCKTSLQYSPLYENVQKEGLRL
jgi:predicted nucleotidyltransferase